MLDYMRNEIMYFTLFIVCIYIVHTNENSFLLSFYENFHVESSCSNLETRIINFICSSSNQRISQADCSLVEFKMK